MGYILALDTSGPDFSIALYDGNSVIQKEVPQIIKHAEVLLPQLQTLLTENNLSLKELDAIAVTIGPGSFTGVRVGVSAVQGLAYGAGLKVIPVSTLAACAMSCCIQKDMPECLVAIDARMDEVFAGSYIFNKELGIVEAISKDVVCKPEDIEKLPALKVGAGSGFALYKDELSKLTQNMLIFDDISPVAKYVAMLGMYYLKEGRAIDAMDLSPVYIRDNVVNK